VAIMPARNSAKTLEATIAEIPPGSVDEIVLVDNASRDDTVAIAERLGLTVVRHPVDRGYGGSIKTCLRTALARGADLIVEIHPDNQYDPAFVPGALAKARSGRYAIVLGSRFLPPSAARKGGMPLWRYVNNRILTFINGRLIGLRVSEFHCGARVYNARWIETLPLDEFSDDFRLGFDVIPRAVEDGWEVSEVPCQGRYFEEASSNPFWGSLRYGVATVSASWRSFCRQLIARLTGRRRMPAPRPGGL
jgi:glycosyltransferase involved in cell wall biosynthesis